jgi:hypothetical protein
MDEVPKEKVTRDQIYKNEDKIQEKLGESFNNAMNHRMKNKDTFNTVFPTNGLWEPEVLLKTTNEIMKPLSYKDPYHDEKYHFKMNWYKRFDEEMAKAKNMMINKKKDLEKKPSKAINK